jgi:pimeloyl-ACP methyl ester carboxylesterase
MWLPQLRGLADIYHVIMPDLPGHGALAQILFTFATVEQVITKILQRLPQVGSLLLDFHSVVT